MDESGSPWPGIVLREKGGNHSLVANVGSTGNYNQGYNGTSINLKRTSQKLYLNNGSKEIVDFANLGTSTFNVPLTFGAGLNGSSSPFRYYNGEINGVVVSLNYSNTNAVTIPNPNFANSSCTFVGWTGSNGDTPETSVTIVAKTAEH